MASCRKIAIFFTPWALSIWFSNIILLFIGPAGLNPERIYQWLSNDPRLSLLLTMATHGGGSILTQTLYLFAMPDLSIHCSAIAPGLKIPCSQDVEGRKGLLFCLSDISATTLESMHTGNSCHLVPKSDTPEGRFIIDASNVSGGRVPLNGTTAKEQAILRYGAICLPNNRGVLSRWDELSPLEASMI